MALDDVEKKLYREGEAKEETIKREGLHIETTPHQEEELGARATSVPHVQPTMKLRLKKFGTTLGIFLAVLLIGSGGLWYFGGAGGFNEGLVGLEIRAPKAFIAGESVRIVVAYQNKSSVDLTNTSLTLTWPKDSLPEGTLIQAQTAKKEIPRILAGREATVEFEGKIFGGKDAPLSFEARLAYTPEGSTAQLESITTASATIGGTPLALEIQLPSRAASDKEFDVTLHYLNTSDTAFDYTNLTLEYPINFIFISSDVPPSSSDNTTWDLGTIAGKSNKTIKIRGKLAAGELGNAKFVATLGTRQGGAWVMYATNQKAVEISTSALVLFTQLNNSRDYIASSGDSLEYKIRYRNTSQVPIANIVIQSKITSKAIDIASLDVRWGSFDQRTGTIIWNASGVPNLGLLAPGSEGEVSFFVKIRKPLPVAGFSDKDFNITTVSKIDSSLIPDILLGAPIGMEDTIETKIRTDVEFRAAGIYRDNLFRNSGPIPPRVGSRTTYTIVWQVTNSSSDIQDLTLETSLPPHTEWTGKINPGNAQFVYTKDTGKLTLTIPKVPAGTGVLTPALTLAFQVALTPSQNQVDTSPVLVNDVVMRGRDVFTGIDFELTAPPVSTTLLGDPSVGEGGGKVSF